MNTKPRRLWTFVATLALVSPVLAQEIPFSIVAEGGGECASANYLVMGTVGQELTGVGELDGEIFLVQGGFWSFPGPNVGDPTGALLTMLDARRDGSAAIVRWELSRGHEPFEFRLWRQGEIGARALVSTAPLAGARSYEFIDPAAPVDETEYWLELTHDGGSINWYGPATLPDLALEYELGPSHPNPFNPMTTLRFSLPEPMRVRLAIFDVRGRQVRTLVDGRQPAGRFTVNWNGRDDSGGDVASGVYFARLESTAGVQSRKMLLAR